MNPAAHAAGAGDGGGGGPSVPLEMDWSFPANGETGVTVTAIIQCKFSHNVAHNDVRERNAQRFSLTTAGGVPVMIDVYMADAQVEFDKRQYVYLIPKGELKEYTTYIVTAQEGIQSKNAMATEITQTFSFTTGSRYLAPYVLVEQEPIEIISQPVTTHIENGDLENSSAVTTGIADTVSAVPKNSAEALLQPAIMQIDGSGQDNYGIVEDKEFTAIEKTVADMSLRAFTKILIEAGQDRKHDVPFVLPTAVFVGTALLADSFQVIENLLVSAYG